MGDPKLAGNTFENFCGHIVTSNMQFCPVCGALVLNSSNIEQINDLMEEEIKRLKNENKKIHQITDDYLDRIDSVSLWVENNFSLIRDEIHYRFIDQLNKVKEKELKESVIYYSFVFLNGLLDIEEAKLIKLLKKRNLLYLIQGFDISQFLSILFVEINKKTDFFKPLHTRGYLSFSEILNIVSKIGTDDLLTYCLKQLLTPYWVSCTFGGFNRIDNPNAEWVLQKLEESEINIAWFFLFNTMSINKFAKEVKTQYNSLYNEFKSNFS